MRTPISPRPLSVALLLSLALMLAGCGGIQSTSAASDPPSTGSDSGSNAGVQITFTANPTTVAAGTSATLTWSTTNATGVSIDNGVGDNLAASGTATVTPAVTTTYTATAKGAAGNATAHVTVTVNTPAPPPAATANYTYKYDNTRQGQYTGETKLTPANVNVTQFGKLFTMKVDGLVFAQPLYAPNVIVNGATHNVLVVATEHDSLYAFDADNGAQLWKTSFLVDGATTVPTSLENTPGGRTALGPEVGITGTPVIDPATNTIYVSAMTLENNQAVHRIHAVDLLTGADKNAMQITATVAGTGVGNTGGQVTFNAITQNQRAALTLFNNTVLVPFGSYSDVEPYHGWLFAYDAQSLAMKAVWNTSPDSEGAAIWQGGGGPAIDAQGNIYVETADGKDPDANTPLRSMGDAFVRLSLDANGFNVLDWFIPYNQACLDSDDLDLGSGAPTLLPDDQGNAPHPHLAIATSKEGRVYLLDRDNLGKFHAGSDSQIPDSKLVNSLACDPTNANLTSAQAANTFRMYSSAAYWNGFVYIAPANTSLRAFQLENGTLAAVGQSGHTFTTRGAMGVVTANGNTNAIVWMQERHADNDTGTNHMILRAFDATNVANELWNSDMNAGRDGMGSGQVFTTPVAINSRIYVASKGQINVFGLLP